MASLIHHFRLFLPLYLLLTCAVLPAQSYHITFQLDMRQEIPGEKIGVRGNIPPLSWEKTFYLEDADQDGIFSGILEFKTEKEELEYKFVRNSDEYELNGEDNRVLPLRQANLKVEATFNAFTPLSREELTEIRFSPEAIREDIAILKLALQTIHPNLYRYTDSLRLEAGFRDLEQKMLVENDLPSAYKHITRFIATIRCSHTITNPWNQSRLLKRALFYQADKLPFTFRLLEDRMFLEKNATDDNRMVAGVEVLKIDGRPVQKILERLVPYISADGSNDAKRWYSLNLSGTEKFETFDILYPLEFPVGESFKLEVKDHRKDLLFTTEVKALSKTRRSAVLQDHYPDLAISDDDLWHFTVQNDQVAVLKLGTFVTWHMQMDWKKFLTDALATLQQQKIPNLVIDIRDNAGGLDEVYAFLLERLVREPLSIHTPASKIAYRQIPNDLRPYIGTWDDSAFDFGNKVEAQPDGNFLSKPTDGKTYKLKPSKDGFRGNMYLITNAANSSATHHMATYVKRYQLGTIVGRPTGGNQRGMNGGMIFFTTLPNTGIEVDIPIFGTYSPEGAPDGGIQPDIPVTWNVEEIIQGRDPDLEAILQRIQARQ